ncbi:hypothetical protein [Puia dinghuensis]|uniref:Anti-sigma factor n=1 Tax=Puia dinghuensis TaxID=1792502 RepID=A0A8J2UIN8_9BACT|nr:hypothetical protein [Puia dinghuensis]GGB21594.1 hypothetical protein GCM10011511_51760 [Puia dinghuensis]
MNSRLEQFVQDHREEFDTEEPDKKIWEKIAQEVNPGKKKRPPLVVRLDWRRFSAAAAVVLLIAGSVWYFGTRTTTQPPMVKTQTSPAGDGGKQVAPLAQAPQTTKDTTQTRSNEPTLATIRPQDNKEDNKAGDLENSMDEEMYHYARLVEIKHNQLKAIEKDEPLLYRQFASDVSKLDSVYHNLQSQLPKNPNREQLLEAMLQNLQLQMGLLNHQLDIIKQINHSKKAEYEKAYKTT